MADLFLQDYPTIGNGVIVKTSTIPGAGQGLFTQRKFESNEIITEYCGKIITYDQAQKLTEHNKQSHVRALDFQFRCIQGIKEPQLGRGGASFVNDPRSVELVNAKWHTKYFNSLGTNRVFLKAVRPLGPNEEVFVTYGNNYWALSSTQPQQPGSGNKQKQQQSPQQQLLPGRSAAVADTPSLLKLLPDQQARSDRQQQRWQRQQQQQQQQQQEAALADPTSQRKAKRSGQQLGASHQVPVPTFVPAAPAAAPAAMVTATAAVLAGGPDSTRAVNTAEGAPAKKARQQQDQAAQADATAHTLQQHTAVEQQQQQQQQQHHRKKRKRHCSAAAAAPAVVAIAADPAGAAADAGSSEQQPGSSLDRHHHQQQQPPVKKKRRERDSPSPSPSSKAATATQVLEAPLDTVVAISAGSNGGTATEAEAAEPTASRHDRKLAKRARKLQKLLKQQKKKQKKDKLLQEQQQQRVEGGPSAPGSNLPAATAAAAAATVVGEVAHPSHQARPSKRRSARPPTAGVPPGSPPSADGQVGEQHQLAAHTQAGGVTAGQAASTDATTAAPRKKGRAYDKQMMRDRATQQWLQQQQAQQEPQQQPGGSTQPQGPVPAAAVGTSSAAANRAANMPVAAAAAAAAATAEPVPAAAAKPKGQRRRPAAAAAAAAAAGPAGPRGSQLKQKKTPAWRLRLRDLASQAADGAEEPQQPVLEADTAAAATQEVQQQQQQQQQEEEDNAQGAKKQQKELQEQAMAPGEAAARVSVSAAEAGADLLLQTAKSSAAAAGGSGSAAAAAAAAAVHPPFTPADRQAAPAAGRPSSVTAPGGTTGGAAGAATAGTTGGVTAAELAAATERGNNPPVPFEAAAAAADVSGALFLAGPVGDTSPAQPSPAPAAAAAAAAALVNGTTSPSHGAEEAAAVPPPPAAAAAGTGCPGGMMMCAGSPVSLPGAAAGGLDVGGDEGACVDWGGYDMDDGDGWLGHDDVDDGGHDDGHQAAQLSHNESNDAEGAAVGNSQDIDEGAPTAVNATAVPQAPPSAAAAAAAGGDAVLDSQPAGASPESYPDTDALQCSHGVDGGDGGLSNKGEPPAGSTPAAGSSGAKGGSSSTTTAHRAAAQQVALGVGSSSDNSSSGGGAAAAATAAAAAAAAADINSQDSTDRKSASDRGSSSDSGSESDGCVDAQRKAGRPRYVVDPVKLPLLQQRLAQRALLFKADSLGISPGKVDAAVHQEPAGLQQLEQQVQERQEAQAARKVAARRLRERRRVCQAGAASHQPPPDPREQLRRLLKVPTGLQPSNILLPGPSGVRATRVSKQAGAEHAPAAAAAAAATAGRRLRMRRQQKGHEPAEGDGCAAAAAAAAAAMVGSLHHHQDQHGAGGRTAHSMPSADPLQLEAAAGCDGPAEGTAAIQGANPLLHQAADGPTLLLHQQLSAEGVPGAMAGQQQQVSGPDSRAVAGGGGSKSRSRSSGYLRAPEGVMDTMQDPQQQEQHQPWWEQQQQEQQEALLLQQQDAQQQEPSSPKQKQQDAQQQEPSSPKQQQQDAQQQEPSSPKQQQETLAPSKGLRDDPIDLSDSQQQQHQQQEEEEEEPSEGDPGNPFILSDDPAESDSAGGVPSGMAAGPSHTHRQPGTTSTLARLPTMSTNMLNLAEAVTNYLTTLDHDPLDPTHQDSRDHHLNLVLADHLVHQHLLRLPGLEAQRVALGDDTARLVDRGMCFHKQQDSSRAVVQVTTVDQAALEAVYPNCSSVKRTALPADYMQCQLRMLDGVMAAAVAAADSVDVLMPLSNNFAPGVNRACVHHAAITLRLQRGSNTPAVLHVYDSQPVRGSLDERLAGITFTLNSWVAAADWAGLVGRPSIVSEYHCLAQQKENQKCGLYTADNLVLIAGQPDAAAPPRKDRSPRFRDIFAEAWAAIVADLQVAEGS